ncbi:MAG: hypothetical protein ABW141_16710, partial [Candidatus Thiodiazotropha endolucinida]
KDNLVHNQTKPGGSIFNANPGSVLNANQQERFCGNRVAYPDGWICPTFLLLIMITVPRINQEPYKIK